MGNVTGQAAPDGCVTAEDIRELKRAVILWRRALARGREPDPRCRDAAGYSSVEVFGEFVDPVAVEVKEAIVKEAASWGLVDNRTEDFDAEVLHLVLDAVWHGFWIGLTRGDVIVSGAPDLPYSLFPELMGYSS